jgi:type I restriction enzyme, S subunit
VEYVPNGQVPIVRSGDLVSSLIYPECRQDFLRAIVSPKLVYLKSGDVLISSIGMGSIGKISLVMDAGTFATVSEVTILRSKGYPPPVLFTYLTTRAGQRQINRQITGATGQQHLLKSKVEMILVPPAPPKTICNSIRESCNRAWDLEIATQNQHAKTHEIFAKTVGI